MPPRYRCPELHAAWSVIQAPGLSQNDAGSETDEGTVVCARSIYGFILRTDDSIYLFGGVGFHGHCMRYICGLVGIPDDSKEETGTW